MARIASASTKDNASASVYPRALSSIIISVGLLAVFITLASWILLSYPVGTVVQSYFYGVDHTSRVDLTMSLEGTRATQVPDEGKPEVSDTDLPKSEGTIEIGENQNVEGSQKQYHAVPSSNVSISGEQFTKNPIQTEDRDSTTNATKQYHKQRTLDNEKQYHAVPSSNVSISGEQITKNPIQTEDRDLTTDVTKDATSAGLPKGETSLGHTDNKESVESDCDLYHGEWFYDSAGPLYTNNSCPVITQMQNCQGNGRPDKEYENWRWRPAQCELPRFNGTKFLELMSGKTLAFVGDSVARNQMESLLCLLWQVEVPKNRGNRRMQRWHFRSKSVMIVRIWSSWLVHQTSEAFGEVPQGVAKLHLDVPDEVFMEFIPTFDVVVLSSGHWFAKQSIYMLNNEIVGTQLWSPPKKQPMKINSVEAFGISVETSLTAMATHPNFTGLAIVRAYSPDHYEGGAWNTGGSCTGKVRPILSGQLVENGFTNSMHAKQVAGFYRATKKQSNNSKLKLLDITEPFSFRHDGHPGPYRNPDPNKKTKRGPDGKPPPQDCLHWCMPGPVDTWNELVLEVIRREFEGNQNSAV